MPRHGEESPCLRDSSAKETHPNPPSGRGFEANPLPNPRSHLGGGFEASLFGRGWCWRVGFGRFGGGAGDGLGVALDAHGFFVGVDAADEVVPLVFVEEETGGLVGFGVDEADVGVEEAALGAEHFVEAAAGDFDDLARVGVADGEDVLHALGAHDVGGADLAEGDVGGDAEADGRDDPAEPGGVFEHGAEVGHSSCLTCIEFNIRLQIESRSKADHQ